MADKGVLATAIARIARQQDRLIPVYHQISWYEALREAETAQRLFISQQSRRAGSAEKIDSLQKFILDAVRAKPSMTHVELLAKLCQEQNDAGPIVEVAEGAISFLDSKDRLRSAPNTGLKDRLSRAKKKLNSL